MHHLHPGQPATRHTEGAHALADRQLLHLRGVEVQEPQNQRATGLILHRHPQLAAAAEHHGGRGNDRLDLSLESLLQPVDGYDDRFVLIAQRQMQDDSPSRP